MIRGWTYFRKDFSLVFRYAGVRVADFGIEHSLRAAGHARQASVLD